MTRPPARPAAPRMPRRRGPPRGVAARSRTSRVSCSAASSGGPIQTLGQILSPAVASVSRRSAAPPSSPPPPMGDVSHHSPSVVLRSFKELRRLLIELPTGEPGIEDGVLLKWKADFGSTLGSCIILGASSVSSKPPPPPTNCSLIAVAARHYLLQPPARGQILRPLLKE